MKIPLPQDFSKLPPSGSVLYSETHSSIFLFHITLIGWSDVTFYHIGIKNLWPDFYSSKLRSDFESSCPPTGPVISLTLSLGPINSANTALLLPSFHFVETVNHPLFTLYDSSKIETRLVDWSSRIWRGKYRTTPNRIRSILGALWIEKLVQRKLIDTLFNDAYDWFLKTRNYRNYRSLPYGTPALIMASLAVGKKPYLVRKINRANQKQN
jgi:hypothetical protein